MTKSKRKKQRRPFGKKELIFNILSIIAVICIGIYFGARSFYYYSKQNTKIEKESATLAAVVLAKTSVTKDDNGLHQDKEGYYFKGKVGNNYVKFANRVFRIVRINNDNSIKLVSEDNASSFMWGDDPSYNKSNLHEWLTKTKNDYSGVYYDTIPNPKKFLVKTKYTEDKLQEEKVASSDKKYSDYITSLTLDDYIMASGKNSYLNNNKYFWIIGHDNDNMNLYIDEDGSIESGTNYESYGIKAVITLKKNIKIEKGDGTVENPYIIDQGKDTNYVDQYIKLKDDIWKIYQDKDNVLKLSLNGYIKGKNGEYLSIYSKTTSEFDPLNRYNIAYYLNKTYYSNLPYNNIILESTFATGEISNETGLSYANIYKDTVKNKVGLLNIFDYNTNNYLDNYYYINTTSTVGSMAYVYNNLGLLSEEKVTEPKHVVPTISISKDQVKGGDGTLENPYVVE